MRLLHPVETLTRKEVGLIRIDRRRCSSVGSHTGNLRNNIPVLLRDEHLGSLLAYDIPLPGLNRTSFFTRF
jgi:hypothetical protein